MGFTTFLFNPSAPLGALDVVADHADMKMDEGEDAWNTTSVRAELQELRGTVEANSGAIKKLRHELDAIHREAQREKEGREQKDDREQKEGREQKGDREQKEGLEQKEGREQKDEREEQKEQKEGRDQKPQKDEPEQVQRPPLL